jgi:hypothetical protein
MIDSNDLSMQKNVELKKEKGTTKEGKEGKKEKDEEKDTKEKGKY